MIRASAGTGLPEHHPRQTAPAAAPPATAPTRAGTAAPAGQPPSHNRGARAFLASVSRRLGLGSEWDEGLREIRANLEEYEKTPTRELAETIRDQHRQLLDKAPPPSLDASYGQYRSVEMDNPKSAKFWEQMTPISRAVLGMNRHHE